MPWGLHALRPLFLLRDIIFPPSCPSCGGKPGGGRECCCAACLSALRPVSRGDDQYREAWAKLAPGGRVAGLTVAWYYEREGVLRELVHALKYRGREDIGESLGRELGMLVRGERPGGIDALLPVPLHPSKLRERGYNQSEAIARGMVPVTGIQVDGGILRRSRWTESQTTLGVEERRENVRGAFTIPPRRRCDVHGGRFLLVDDIVTTGSTLLACAETLGAGGAACVRCCALGLPR